MCVAVGVGLHCHTQLTHSYLCITTGTFWAVKNVVGRGQTSVQTSFDLTKTKGRRRSRSQMPKRLPLPPECIITSTLDTRIAVQTHSIAHTKDSLVELTFEYEW